MARTAERRADVRQVVPGARSVIVTATLYNTDRPDLGRTSPDVARISRYAWGDDYHDVLKARLNELLDWMREQSDEPFEARAYVDTGPVQERVYAQYAGLGWIGKNTCLINPELGLLAVSRRDHLHAAARAGYAGPRAVRKLHALSRRLSRPARSSSRVCSTRIAVCPI